MQIPFSERLKSIPGAVGIRLEEELPYDVVNTVGELELRSYRPFTLARFSAAGTFDSASELCFRQLAEFIFGANSENKSTKMTTPVFIDRKGDEWTMSFYLPEDVAHLVPTNSSISIELMPAKQVAVYSFSGTFDQEAMNEAKLELLKLLRSNNLVADSDVWWAQFDQPVSLPFTKRNEALVKISYLS